MKNFVNSLTDLIIEGERERLDKIMYEVAQNVQKDVIEVTYKLIDAYYSDYTYDKGRVYIRTDEYHRPRNKSGRFKQKSEKASKSKRSNDVSLRSAIKALENGEPAIGVCRPLGGSFGYQAGVVFDEEKLVSQMKHRVSQMKHSVMGTNFQEWYIVENFLAGVHGADDVYITAPSADMILDNYIYSYHANFDKHYKNALKKNIK